MTIYNISGTIVFPNNLSNSITLSIKSKSDFKFDSTIAISSNGVYNFNIEGGDYILSLNDDIVTSHLHINSNGTLNSLILNYLNSIQRY